MIKDIRALLEGWTYDPGTISARWVKGLDGKPKVQLRLDLGLLQMELDGRPDGRKAGRFETFLARLKDREAKAAPFSAEAGELSDADLSGLQQEAVQYYYRYLSFYALKHFDGVIRDTQHNLELIEYVDERVEDDEDAWQFLQFYPYVRMMNARARAEKALRAEKFREARDLARQGAEDIYGFWMEQEDMEEAENSSEIAILNDLIQEIDRRRPVSPEERLKAELDSAIKDENYEKAAKLRDALRNLG